MDNSFDQVFRGTALTAAGGAKLDVADVFRTFLYDGTNGDNHAIVNGIDLSGEGGLVWIKSREVERAHALYDTARGVHKYLQSDHNNAAQVDLTNSNDKGVKAFNANGFTMDDDALVNADEEYVSWTFRKAEKFFDIVTYEGNSQTSQTLNHNLGSVPGMMIVKRYDGTGEWWVYHRGNTAAPQTDFLRLSASNATEDYAGVWNDTAPTSTQFTVGSDSAINYSSRNYVAYIFAHNNNDGEFGPDADQDIISCGSFAYDNGNTPAASVTLGWEPQWVLTKNSASGNWNIHDSMRGMFASARGPTLYPDGEQVESATAGVVLLNSTGFTVANGVYDPSTHIYMAIRAPMITPPAAATDVFAIDTANSTSNAPPVWNSGFPVDMAFYNVITGGDRTILSRMTGKKYLKINASNADANDDDGWDFMNGWYNDSFTNSNFYSWMWKRAKGYFDVVTYTGTESARTVAHSLGVAPEMMWIKCRNAVHSWAAYHVALGNTGIIYLDSNEAAFSISGSTVLNNTTPTSSVFTVGANHVLNQNTKTYVAYLFATVAGISKLGSVAHSGSSTDVDCGFSAGARVVMLKRTDATGDWFWWDSTRGIIAGNDPYFVLNTTAAQVTNTDYIDPLASGFQISGDFTDGDYIFYAVA